MSLLQHAIHESGEGGFDFVFGVMRDHLLEQNFL
jgi:hypothetical protein